MYFKKQERVEGERLGELETFERKQSWWDTGSKSDEGRNEDIRGFMEIEKIGSFVCVCVCVCWRSDEIRISTVGTIARRT